MKKTRSAAQWFVALPSFLLFTALFCAVVLGHATLLHLPYFWDEGGYYVPAALDFYHHGQIIPAFTNAHPPLPNILIGCAWKIFGVHILVTRLLACAAAAGALLAVLRISQFFLRPAAALSVAVLTGVYSIWYAQSSLAHADIFAACLTLWGLHAFLRAEPLADGETRGGRPQADGQTLVLLAGWFTLASLAKETAIVQPLALAGLEAVRAWRSRCTVAGAAYLRRALALSFPVMPLALWFAYHRWRTGFIFGNPEFLRYNATANFTFAHVSEALRYRFVHLFWQRNIWFPLLFAGICLAWPRHRSLEDRFGLPAHVLKTIGVVVAVNWLAFSVLGGALLTRYLLPIYPLLLLVCVAAWTAKTAWWPLFVATTAALFISAWWINPPTFFAPEDNLTYRDMIEVHEEAIRFVAARYPEASILSAWPVGADLLRPELGYVSHPFRVISIENFSAAEVRKAAAESETFDTAIVFPTRYVAPSLQRYLVEHPGAQRTRDYNKTRDLSPAEIARVLGGHIVWQQDHGGEWAVVLRFPRSYEARNTLPLCMVCRQAMPVAWP